MKGQQNRSFDDKRVSWNFCGSPPDNYWKVPEDATCEFICEADNGVPYRTNTAKNKLTCERPIPPRLIDSKLTRKFYNI